MEYGKLKREDWQKFWKKNKNREAGMCMTVTYLPKAVSDHVGPL